MTCEEMESRMAERWRRTLSLEQQREVEAHLPACETCRAQAHGLGALWRDLARLPEPEPGAGMRPRFYETLAAYRDGAAAAGRKAPEFGWAWQIAAGVVLALAGVGAGYSLRSSQTANAEI